MFGEGNNSPSRRSSPLNDENSFGSSENFGYGFNYWYYNANDDNMSQVNGPNPLENGYDKVALRNKTKNESQRPSSSGFHSFLKFFSGSNRNSSSGDVNGRLSTEVYDHVENNNNNNTYNKIRPRLRSSESPANSSSSGGTDSTSSPTLELGSNTELSSSNSTSCDSLFSIATTGFSFVPVDIYQPDGNTLKVS